MADAVLDAFIDSLKVLAIVAVCTYIIAIIEPLLSNKIRLHGALAPLIGVSVSILPQCGFSIVAADLYQKRHLTLGTLIGVFLATSDEALPIFLSYPSKALHILPIILIKFLLGLIIGYSIDFIFSKNRKSVSHHVKHCDDDYRIRLMHCESAEREDKSDLSTHCDCDECKDSLCTRNHIHKSNLCEKDGILAEYLKKYSIKKDRNEKLNRFLLKPLLHSLEIFIYVLIINIIFAVIIHSIGQDKIINFLLLNKYIAPLFSVIIGAIPNCASSIIISELYIMGGLGFGATLGGLCMNAGLGFVFLFKDTKNLKRNLFILILMFLISIAVSYLFSFIFKFSVLDF
ncbi:MAG: arsenic efflux protein [Bacteroides sp.]|nr:arsenic efflux protein [Bacillota bacterium]MCM1393725.1 arsenic efflux protein [[Eubacterium] siraeum]MCM1455243.1 arsenic efflux protein [Bacteroides sp.]